MLEYFTLKTKNQGIIDVGILEPKSPKGIVQIIHGALEYKERYLPFGEFLQKNGYIVVLSDNRGHGKSISDTHSKGFMESWEDLVSDQNEICQFVKKKFPTLPYYLLGHSFGSILARLFLQKHDGEIDKLVLTGTVNYIPIVPLGLKLSGTFLKIYGSFGHSKLLAKLTGDLEAKDNSWLSNNPENNLKAKNDPQMLSEYPVKSSLTIWESNYQLKQYHHFKCAHPELKILSLVGSEDVKITGGDKGLKDTVQTLNKIGYKNVKSIVMPGMKHEVLNEKNNQLVFNEILNFLKEK